jgi:hypothetical protein
MPRDIASNTTKFIPLYTITTKRLVERLTTAKASTSVWSVVLCLKAYAMDKDTCFPNHKTIQSWCGGNISIRSIERSVKWLEDHNFIKRNGRRSRNRYVLYIDKHKQPEAKSKPTEVAGSTRQSCRQKKIREQELKTPNPFSKGELTKEGRVRKPRRQRRAQTTRELTKDEQALKHSTMLTNALDYLTIGMVPPHLPEGVHGALLGAVEPWFEAMDSKKRAFLKLKSKSDLSRVYEAISLLLPEVE